MPILGKRTGPISPQLLAEGALEIFQETNKPVALFTKRNGKLFHFNSGDYLPLSAGLRYPLLGDLKFQGNKKLQFRDPGLVIYSSTDGQLDIEADTELQIDAPILQVDSETIDLTTQASDIDLIDDNASALSLDTAGKAGILAVVTTDGSEGITMSGTLAVSGDATVNGNHALEGYSTGRNVIRSINMRIQPGATPGTNININRLSSTLGFNQISYTDTTDLAKSGSSNEFALSADGATLTIDFTEAVVGILSTTFLAHDINSSSTSELYTIFPDISSGNILLRFLLRPAVPNSFSDITTIMDTGDAMTMQITFVTSS